MKYWLILVFSSAFMLTTFSQTRKPKLTPKDSLSSEAFVKMIDETLNAFYADYANQSDFDSIINSLEYEPNSLPEFSDEIICKRLQAINETSSFKLACNPTSLSVIRFFAKNRRNFAKIVLGRSALYFDMYEAHLAKYDLPKELKYLSVIESGLRPQVKSHAGALGLWQFMYGTGKMYGLKDNSYMDERMDPFKSTDAACRYLKKLHGTYNDWNLALAAYNAGPGNVNKAIRRSGGKLTYWEIRPFLPKETQGYVPNFIAATYLLTYHAEHNIKPAPAKIHFHQLDTICFSQGVHMSTISQLVDWNVEDIKTLNPVYKATYIPFSSPAQCISGPLQKIGKLVSLSDSLYALEDFNYNPSKSVTPTLSDDSVQENEASNDSASQASETVVTKYVYHKVRKGETLYKIATRYGTTTGEISRLNGLRKGYITVGKSLKIPQKVTVSAKVITPIAKDANVESSTSEEAALQMVKSTVAYDSAVSIYHVVQRNESLKVIAEKYKVTVEEIRQWNGLKDNWINIGQRIKIYTVIKLAKDVMVPEATATPKAVETPKPAKPKAAPVKYHSVKRGEFFGRIASQYGLSIPQLQKLNPGVRPDRIAEGQKIRVK
jgi:membrane-bound lytic murein transglycosylase D